MLKKAAIIADILLLVLAAVMITYDPPEGWDIGIAAVIVLAPGLNLIALSKRGNRSRPVDTAR